MESLTIPSAHGSKPFREVMAPYQREWFQAIAPSLLAIARGEKPPLGRFWCERTKGGSKDSDVGRCIEWLMAFCPHKLHVIVGASDRDQAGEAKRAIEDDLRLNPWLGQRIEVQSWTLLCRATGSECNIVASDVAGSHGSRPDIVFLNELSHVTKEEFAQNLLDNATKKPQGLVIVASNSGFLGSWQERWRNIARKSDRWHFHALSQPAPWLSEAELEEARQRSSSARFHRLYWGVWPSQSGDALDDADIQACISSSIAPGTVREGEFTVAGLDLGIKHDHSALVVVAGSYESLSLRLVLAQSWKPGPNGKCDLMRIEDAIAEAHKRYDFLQIGYDPFQAALMAQRLAAQGVPMQEMTFTGSNLNLMATTLLEVFRSRRMEMYDMPALIADLGRLSIEERSYGHRLSAVSNESGHADLATALAIALPLAVDAAGNPAVVLGRPMFGPGSEGYGESQYEAFLQRQRAHRAEQEEFNQPETRQESFQQALREGRVTAIGARHPFMPYNGD